MSSFTFIFIFISLVLVHRNYEKKSTNHLPASSFFYLSIINDLKFLCMMPAYLGKLFKNGCIHRYIDVFITDDGDSGNGDLNVSRRK